MLNAIIILSVLLFLAIMFALGCLVHAKYTMSMLKITAEYALALKKANDSILANQKNLIDNHFELMNRFNNLVQWTINHGLCAEDTPEGRELEDRDDERMWGDPSDPNTYDGEEEDEPVQETFDFDGLYEGDDMGED